MMDFWRSFLPVSRMLDAGLIAAWYLPDMQIPAEQQVLGFWAALLAGLALGLLEQEFCFFHNDQVCPSDHGTQLPYSSVFCGTKLGES